MSRWKERTLIHKSKTWKECSPQSALTLSVLLIVKRPIHSLFLLLALIAISACQRKESADEAFDAKIARLESKRLDASFDVEVIEESSRVMETAKMLTPYLTKNDASWFPAEIAEVAYPPAGRSPSQRMQKAREVHARLKDELRRRK